MGYKMKALTKEKEDYIKKAFDLLPSSRLNIRKVTGGWNIRVIKPSVTKDEFKTSFREILENGGHDPNRCMKCGISAYCHPHHIIRKSAGGQDDSDNGVFLCFDCHVGSNGIHNGVWYIEDIIPDSILVMLSERYKYGLKR